MSPNLHSVESINDYMKSVLAGISPKEWPFSPDLEVSYYRRSRPNVDNDRDGTQGLKQHKECSMLIKLYIVNGY